MGLQLSHSKTNRTSNRSKIRSILEKNPLTFDSSSGILIGSRAARHYLPSFRGISKDANVDYDIIISSNTLLKWLDAMDKRI